MVLFRKIAVAKLSLGFNLPTLSPTFYTKNLEKPGLPAVFPCFDTK
jgi:hypothetical protein